jgi:ABC-type phosphate transport system substrate-binding protein
VAASVVHLSRPQPGARRSRGLRARQALIVAILIAVVVAAVTVVPREPAADAAGRTLTATPSSGITGQVVVATWSGFDPANPVGLFQCKGAVPSSMSDCYQVQRPPAGGDPNGTAKLDGLTQADGTGTAFIDVQPAPVLPQLGCSKNQDCSVIAVELDGSAYPANGLPVRSAVARLQFAPGPSDCPSASTPDVTTEGEASTAPALYAWGGRVCTAADRLALDYTETSSNSGRRSFLADEVDVALTSLPPVASEIAEATRKDYTYAPVDVSAVVVAFNVTDPTTGQRISDLTLSPRLLAMMIAGNQPSGRGTHLFDDPEFLRLNPGHVWPLFSSAPLLRSELNADAWLTTNLLQQDTAARQFLDGTDTICTASSIPQIDCVDRFWKGITYPTDVFESRNATAGGLFPRQGTRVNAQRLFNFQPAAGDVGASLSVGVDGGFGIMDVVTARKFGLPTAKLLPANAAPGTPGVAADQAGMTAALKAMKTNEDGVTKIVDPRGPGYPITKIDYAMVPTSGLSETKRADVAKFLAYAAGDGQSAGVLPPGYLPLTDDLVTENETASAAVVAGTETTTTNSLDIPADSGFGDFGSLDSGFSDYGSSFSDTGSYDTAAGGSSSPNAVVVTGGSTGLVNALRDFLGGDVAMLLPLLVALGAIALVAGPILTFRARRPVPVAAAAAGGDGPAEQ